MVCVLQSLCLSGTTCNPFFLSFFLWLFVPPSLPHSDSSCLLLISQPPFSLRPEQTTPVLSTHNSSSGVSKLDKFFVSFSNGHRKGTRVPHGGCFCSPLFLNMWIIFTNATNVWIHLWVRSIGKAEKWSYGKRSSVSRWLLKRSVTLRWLIFTVQVSNAMPEQNI